MSFKNWTAAANASQDPDSKHAESRQSTGTETLGLGNKLLVSF